MDELTTGLTTHRRPIRLAVVDDDPLVRTGLALLLAGFPEIEIVAEAADGGEVDQVVAAHWPDVVLMDIRMPGVDGLVATERLRSMPTAPSVIVLTTFNADGEVLRALRAGASGFLLKDAAPTDIVHAIRVVAAGEAMLSPPVIRQLIAHVADATADSRRDRARTRLTTLSPRERAVAVALGRGSSNAEIGIDLRMSVPTVKGHVSRLMAKLGLNNRVQVALLVHDADLDR